jgi:RNA polymerase sigma factor (sigma-70 family)
MKSNVLRMPSAPIPPSEAASMPKRKPRIQRIDACGRAQRARALRDALVEAHLPLVRQIAQSVARSLPPSFDLEDLIGEGNLALLQCATRFQPDAHGNPPFAAFARQRIRGAIIDSVRRRHYLERTRPSIDDVTPASCAPVVEISIDRLRLGARVREAIMFLPDDQRELIVARYLEERRGRGVTADLNSETRMIAIDALRRRLKAA